MFVSLYHRIFWQCAPIRCFPDWTWMLVISLKVCTVKCPANISDNIIFMPNGRVCGITTSQHVWDHDMCGVTTCVRHLASSSVSSGLQLSVWEAFSSTTEGWWVSLLSASSLLFSLDSILFLILTFDNLFQLCYVDHLPQSQEQQAHSVISFWCRRGPCFQRLSKS